MEIVETDPARRFQVGIDGGITLFDRGRISLLPGETLRLETRSGFGFEMEAYAWGFLLQPALSVLSRHEGLAPVIAGSGIERLHLMLVGQGHEDAFDNYCRDEAISNVFHDLFQTTSERQAPFVGSSAKRERPLMAVSLDQDEQVTLLTTTRREFDIVCKDWGFYASPSFRTRMAHFGLRPAVAAIANEYYFAVVEAEQLDKFEADLSAWHGGCDGWLDDMENLRRMGLRIENGDTNTGLS